jgi:hypothetical protein
VKEPKLWAIFFHGKSYVLILTQNWLGYILGIFSQTHLVTLSQEERGVRGKGWSPNNAWLEIQQG